MVMKTARILFQGVCTCCQSDAEAIHESIKSARVINPSQKSTFITCNIFTYRHVLFSDIKCKTSHVTHHSQNYSSQGLFALKPSTHIYYGPHHGLSLLGGYGNAGSLKSVDCL